MANKNHSLDSRISQSAFEEFMEKGYEKASMRKIASNAGVTIGAIYTRYATKDSLFCSLVAPLVDSIGRAFGDIKALYMEAQSLGAEKMMTAMKRESEIILHLLFDDYDRAVLLLCRSSGSSLETFLEGIVQRKIEETLVFFQNAGMRQMDESLLRFLITTQFRIYFQIIEDGFDLAEGKRLMNAAMIYNAGGWMALLNAFQQESKGDLK